MSLLIRSEDRSSGNDTFNFQVDIPRLFARGVQLIGAQINANMVDLPNPTGPLSLEIDITQFGNPMVSTDGRRYCFHLPIDSESTGLVDTTLLPYQRIDFDVEKEISQLSIRVYIDGALMTSGTIEWNMLLKLL